MKKILFLAAAGLFMSAAGCSSYKPFIASDPSAKIKPSTVAVIAASRIIDKASPLHLEGKALAKQITLSLVKQSTFKVIPQERIAEILPEYPVPMIDFAFEEGKKSVTPEISPAAKEKLAAVQRVLKADYIILVWASGWSVVNGGGCCGIYGGHPYVWSAPSWICVNTRMIQYPKENVIGYSYFETETKTGFFEKADKTIQRMIEDSGEDFADEFVKVTASAKPQKK